MEMVTPFLMFTGRAEEAMNFYISLFPDSEIISISLFWEDEGDMQGKVLFAEFSLADQHIMCIDSPDIHEFTFTSSTSLYVTCRSEQEIDHFFAKLSEGGQVLMPLEKYPFSEKYTWVNDRFGVSWQLTLASA